jgi:hypothetical protein
VQAAHPWRPRTSDLCLQSSPTVVHTFIPVVHAKYAWRGGHVQLTSEKIFEVADVSSGWPILGCIESTSAQLMNPGLNRNRVHSRRRAGNVCFLWAEVRV